MILQLVSLIQLRILRVLLFNVLLQVPHLAVKDIVYLFKIVKLGLDRTYKLLQVFFLLLDLLLFLLV